MKKLISIVLCFAMLFSLCSISSAFAEETPINVTINGTNLEMDQSPIMVNDHVLVPMRAIYEKLGASVQWDENSQQINAIKENKIIIMQVGNSKVFLMDGGEITLDTPPQVVNDRTLVPIRAVAECLGADVNWDEANNTVAITITEPAATATPDATESVTPPAATAPADENNGDAD